ncbi:MAG: hypothetical protein GX066_00090, partial [Clostridiaceae bacterium]|nr:hypothetical protein [Clostridiaceae bacterium]
IIGERREDGTADPHKITFVFKAGLNPSPPDHQKTYSLYPDYTTGEFENDPNVTDKKFPGNLTRSYRSKEPLKIIGEVTEWAKLTTNEQGEWHEKLANNKGEIIN